MQLSNLKIPARSRKRRKLLGRGESSGHGKTCCRGGKGQTARSGGTIRIGFEGGQMPLYRRLPKFGFNSRNQALGVAGWANVTLAQLNAFDDGAVVDANALAEKGLLTQLDLRRGVKILANGELKKKLTLKVSRVSAAAKSQIEAAGGSIELV
jgi:large subunit ribosomal protein L15